MKKNIYCHWDQIFRIKMHWQLHKIICQTGLVTRLCIHLLNPQLVTPLQGTREGSSDVHYKLFYTEKFASWNICITKTKFCGPRYIVAVMDCQLEKVLKDCCYKKKFSMFSQFCESIRLSVPILSLRTSQITHCDHWILCMEVLHAN